MSKMVNVYNQYYKREFPLKIVLRKGRKLVNDQERRHQMDENINEDMLFEQIC
jgi:hypothetical protein